MHSTSAPELTYFSEKWARPPITAHGPEGKAHKPAVPHSPLLGATQCLRQALLTEQHPHGWSHPFSINRQEGMRMPMIRGRYYPIYVFLCSFPSWSPLET